MPMQAVVQEVALPIGADTLKGDEASRPVGCEDAVITVSHDPVKSEVAALARQFYYTRQLAEEVAHQPAADERVVQYASDLAQYANDLEFYARQVALSLEMPVMVNKPYLPVDLAEMPLPLAFLAASANLALSKAATSRASARRRSPGHDRDAGCVNPRVVTLAAQRSFRKKAADCERRRWEATFL
eukprot:TRINITY_DN92699_c0_g1_i1.p1 TRINITY_DN92699_c0_g1~~TRINITY_DN92699_c0_g1_i1.p1  ORF type:complete len:208 (+),score=30.87 TRINITY_DN92699_c0_g1_i1:67-624(+)